MNDTELPDFIDQDVLLDISTVDVPDEALLRCFVKANKPFLSNSAVAEMAGLSDEGSRQRLQSLVERGVLLSAEAGKQTNIYWLNNPQSSWPVPADLDRFSGTSDRMAETVARINRLTTFTIIYAATFAGMYLLDWLSGLQVTDGVFDVSLTWTVMPALAFALLGILFYIGFQTSLLVESDDAWWPTVRRIYRTVVQ